MPHRIVFKAALADDIFVADVEAPAIAQARKPGQFVIVSLSENAERIPLTIAGADPDRGTIRLIWQALGKSTLDLAQLKVDQTIANVAGPLGRPTHLDDYGLVVCVGGGIGAAPLLPIAQALKARGNRIISILGARSQDRLILVDDFAQCSDELIVVTDDGSNGHKALVTEPLTQCCQKAPPPGHVFAIGPAVMMKFCCEVTRPFDIATEVSLNTIMIDGTGMCGGCRVDVGGKAKFVCVDGPEFDGHLVDFDLMIKRQGAYQQQERTALEAHRCRLGIEA